MDREDEQGHGLQNNGGSSVEWVAMAHTVRGQSTGQAELGMGDGSAMCLTLNPQIGIFQKDSEPMPIRKYLPC